MKKSILLLVGLLVVLQAQTKIDTAKILEEYAAQEDTTSIEYIRQKQIELRTQSTQSDFIEGDSTGDTLVEEYNELELEPSYRTSLQQEEQPLENFGFTFLQSLLYDKQVTLVPLKKSKQKDTVVTYTPKAVLQESQAPVNAGYRLGTGDEIVINIWGDVQQVYTVLVDRSGGITVPGVGQVVVAGLTLSETKKILTSKFTRVFSGIRNGRKNATTFLDISMGRIRGKSVIVAGNVRLPGTHVISATGGIVAAIAAAGGPLESGTVREIIVQHGGADNDTVDLYSFLLTGKLSDTVHIADYDVIIVPPKKHRVALSGAVVRPAYYDMLESETAADLIEMAGGFLSEAYTGNISLTRTFNGKNREAAPFSYEKDSQTNLQPGDSLFVSYVFEEKNEITIEGSVKQPGTFGYYDGFSLYDALQMAGGVTEDFFPDRLEILRVKEDLKKEIIAVNLDKLISSEGAEENVALQKRDVIKVFSIWDLDTREYVVIRGEVKKPGKYFLRKGMTVQDLILLAGGLSEYAYKDTIEISRIVDENKLDGNSTKSNKIEVSMNFFQRSEFPLQHKDNVFVRTNSSYKDQAVVVLQGEFSFPGPYAKQHENETLLSLIERAGGLKTTAYLQGAVFIRGKDSIGVVSIDLVELLKSEQEKDDIILEDGDTLFIPTEPKTVLVKGQVNYPTAVKYVPGKNIRYYLKRAGGFSSKADKRATYSILANGAVKNVRGSSKHVNAGTQIVVPEKEEVERRVEPTVVAAFLTALSVIAVAFIK